MGQLKRTGEAFVSEEKGRVVCTVASIEEAEMIVREHNTRDPIKSYWDWLEHKC